jgi:hypothetical protein
MTIARADHWATLLSDGRVLILGGRSCVLCTSDPAETSAEFYDPSLGKFTPANVTFTTRGSHEAILLPDGKVLIAGGIAIQDGRTLITNDVNAEIYDPATDTFAMTGAYADSTPLSLDSATLLLDGRVLITGCAAQCTSEVAEVFDPKSNTFSRTGPRRVWFDIATTATLLTDGTVLFVESNFDIYPDDVELYDPVTGVFTHIGQISEFHELSAAVRLADGTVLISGGQLPGGKGRADTQLYLPASGTFTFAGSMTTGRHSHTTTVLPDGTVLIAGGYSVWPTPTSSAEIYKPSASH